MTPPARLVFTWTWESSDRDRLGLREFYETFVTIELRTVSESTELTLAHEFFPTTEERDKHQSGWTGCLTRLSKVL